MKGWITGSRTDQHGRTSLHMVRVEGVKQNTSTHPNQPRASSPINDNYCVKVLQTGLLAGSKQPTPDRTLNIISPETVVNSVAVNHVSTAPGLLQKKDVSPSVSELQIKICERCFIALIHLT